MNRPNASSSRPLTLRRFLPLGAALALLPGCYLMCPYNADQFFETQVRAECHFWFACCTAAENLNPAATARFGDLNRFKDEGQCVQERLEEGVDGNVLLRAIVQAEQAGRFKFDAATWQTCQQPLIDALNSCNADFVLGDAAPTEVAEACQGIPGTGTVAADDACYFDFECATPGSDCIDPALDEEVDPDPEEPEEILVTQPKKCLPPLKEGDDCSVDPDKPLLPTTCEIGTICFTQSDGDQECEQPHQNGDDCNSSADCDVGLFCDAGECDDLKGEGDACNAEDECELGLICDFTRAEPECEAPLPVIVEICNGVQGAEDPVYANGGN